MNPTRSLPVPLGLLIVAVVAAAALVGSGLAYSNANDWAARVNGREISEREFLDELAVLSTNPAIKELDPSLAELRAGSVPANLASGLLSSLVLSLVVQDIAEEEGLQVTEAVRAETEQGFVQQFGGEEAWETLPRSFRERLIRRESLFRFVLDQLGGGPTEADLRAEYAALQADLLEACASHILVETQEQALALKAQLDAGADFAAIAQANSIDTASGENGGDLGCQRRGSYVEPFDSEVFTLPVDTVSPPVQTQFGFHLIKVVSRGVAPFEEVRPELEQRAQAASQERVTAAILKAVGDADIEVNPKYCTFQLDANGPQCIPPVAPQPPDRLPVGGVQPAEEPTGFLPTDPSTGP